MGVILKRVLRKRNGTTWSGLIWLRILIVVAGCCEGANKILGSLECGESFKKWGEGVLLVYQGFSEPADSYFYVTSLLRHVGKRRNFYIVFPVRLLNV
jgi:hypothetical protein